MKIMLLAAAGAILLTGQAAPAFAQERSTTASEMNDARQDRTHANSDLNGVRQDDAHIRQLNAQRRALIIRMGKERGPARAADQKELTHLNEEEASARKSAGGLLSREQATHKDYESDLQAAEKKH